MNINDYKVKSQKMIKMAIKEEILNLNDSRKRYRGFHGENLREMYNISKDDDGRVPMNVRQIVEARNEAFYSRDMDFRDSWWDNSFDSVDGIAYGGPKSEVVIVRNSDNLQHLYPWIEFKKILDGSLILSEQDYESLKGLRISRSEFDKYACKDPEKDMVSSEEVLNNPVWNYLFYGKEKSLEEHIDYIFTRKGYKKAMRIFVDQKQKEVPTLRAWHIKKNNSDLYGTYHLDDPNGRLVGILSEIPFKETLTDSNGRLSQILKELASFEERS